jgi:hypothetical protein
MKNGKMLLMDLVKCYLQLQDGKMEEKNVRGGNGKKVNLSSDGEKKNGFETFLKCNL